jgi:hypothetical protein
MTKAAWETTRPRTRCREKLRTPNSESPRDKTITHLDMKCCTRTFSETAESSIWSKLKSSPTSGSIKRKPLVARKTGSVIKKASKSWSSNYSELINLETRREKQLNINSLSFFCLESLLEMKRWKILRKRFK